MCGRFYIDDDLKEELDQLLQELNAKLKTGMGLKAGEVFPTNKAAVLQKSVRQAEVLKWGFPGWKSSKVIFNARSETALQKKMFERGFLENRCIIPVSGFFEWDSHKTKYYIRQKGEHVMYLGGITEEFQGEKYFTILTKEAVNEMKTIHERMPVVIMKEQAADWLTSLQDAKKMVYDSKPLLQLERAKKEPQEYEQLHIFNTFNM